MMNNMKKIISEAKEEALFADGFDDAIIGHCSRRNKNPFRDSDFAVVYDYNKCLKILQDRDGMTENEADEYMEFNVIGAYVGIYTPVFVNLIEKEK